MMDDSLFVDLITIDLRGLACPEPVLKTKKLLENQNVRQVEAIVDDEINVQNLERLARSLNLGCQSDGRGNCFRVLISRINHQNRKDPLSIQNLAKDKNIEEHNHPSVQNEQNGDPIKSKSGQTGTVIFITKDVFGDGDREFSQNLMNIFLQSILQSGHVPRAILMANSGVKLLAERSPFLKVLTDFRARGTEVLACGLCIEFYGLEKVVAKEQITNMLAICQYLIAADRVLTP